METGQSRFQVPQSILIMVGVAAIALAVGNGNPGQPAIALSVQAHGAGGDFAIQGEVPVLAVKLRVGNPAPRGQSRDTPAGALVQIEPEGAAHQGLPEIRQVEGLAGVLAWPG